MGGFHVVPEDVSRVAAQMADINQGINAQMNQLLSQLSALPDLWRGPASTSFHAAKERWVELAVHHNRRLADIAQARTRTHSDYIAGETTNASGFSSTPPSSSM